MKTILDRIHDQLVDLNFTQLVFPNLCIGCETVLRTNEDLICFPCQHQLPLTYDWLPTTPSNQTFKGRVEIDQFVSYVYFSKGAIIQRMMHELKYKGRKDVGIGLGKLLGNHLKQHGIFAKMDGLVAVPLHPAKVLRRGYNQSDMIVKGMAEKLGLKDFSNVIARTEYTNSQTTMNRFNRFRNMDKVFKCTQQSRIRNKHLVLVDDVVTTGSTLQACANTLFRAGASSISIATIARA